MTRDEHKAAINRLLGMVSPEHQADASELLTNLSQDYEQTLTTSEQAAANVETLTANFEHLREVNAKLFLQVPTGKVNEPTTHPEPVKQPETPPSFESLFNEKGELI